MEMFETLEESQLQANQGTFNAILDALRGQPARAIEFWKLGMERGFYANAADSDLRKGGIARLDLHDLSEGAAEAAVLWWLEEAWDEALKAGEVQALEVITGWGKSRPAYSLGDVYGTVERLFDEMEVPLLETDNPGSLLVDLAGWAASEQCE
jgi:hypothetical protein